MWVTFRSGVYDITDFVSEHPGGPARILMAKGSSVEPFWAMYRQHFTPAVQETLATLRIGSLDAAEAAEAAKNADANDPYAKDPLRHPALVVRQDKPFNAECPPALMSDSWVTPAELWFVRHHHPVPDIDADEYRLVVQTPKGKVSFSLSELQSYFPKRTVTTTIQCGGNRRSQFNAVAMTQGLPWDVGAISTATWGGVMLRDVLKAAGVPDDIDAAEADGVTDVQFVGGDEPYDASVPVETALNPRADVMLAFEMNGAPLPREHGAPVRAIVPGHIGARNVKWVKEVRATNEEAYSTWQRGLPYKGVSPNVKSFKGVDPSKLPTVMELPVTSAIVEPAPGSALEAEPDVSGEAPTDRMLVSAKGYAWAGGGRSIVRVDVSADDGKTWHTAELQPEGQQQPRGRAWAWTQWTCDVPVPAEVVKAGSGKVTLVCKATDSSFNVQPERADGSWNLRGILMNAWHRVPVEVDASG